MTLLDLLPAFLSLSATAIAREASNQITETWMHLAAGFMLQAVIEQYVDHGSRNGTIVKDAFSWGFDPDANFREGTDEFAVNAMFLDEDDEFAEWQNIKESHVNAVGPLLIHDLCGRF